MEKLGQKAMLEEFGFNQDRSKIAAFVLAAVAMVVFSLIKPKSAGEGAK